MKIFTKTINEMEVKAYNDSNAEWVVSSSDPRAFSEMRFDKRKFTMKRAMAFYASFKLEV